MKIITLKEILTSLSILSVVYAVEFLTTTALDQTEIGTMVAVAFCLVVFEAGRITERRHATEQIKSCWVDFSRILVVFVSVSLMYALYSKNFDYDETLRISLIAVAYSIYLGIQSGKYWLKQLPEQDRLGLKSSADVVWQTFLKAFATALGTAMAAALTGLLGFVAKPYLMLLLKH